MNSAVGIAHVGWRGVLGGVAKKTIAFMIDQFKTVPGMLLVIIGPGIRKCHYDIKSDNRTQYREYEDFVAERGGKVFADLPGIIKAQFGEMGIAANHIEDSEICTYCNAKEYFSYHRDKPEEVQPMLGYIGLVS